MWQAVPRQMHMVLAALRLQVKQGVKRDHAVDLSQRDIRLGRNVFQNAYGQVLLRIPLLGLLQDAQQRAWTAAMFRDHTVHKIEIGGLWLSRLGVHQGKSS